jgi:hypothetical protein
MNSESQISDGWDRLKHTFRDKCEKLSKFSPTIKLECEEPDLHRFYVNHKGRGGRAVLELTLDLGTSRVICEDRWSNRSKSVDIVVAKSNVIFANGGSAIILPQFVDQLLMQITRP